MNDKAPSETTANMTPLMVKKTNRDNSNIAALSEEFAFEPDNSLLETASTGISAGCSVGRIYEKK